MGRDRGLFQKYIVTRVDGKPMPAGCIVLEWKDPNARKGIRAFADACWDSGFKQLAVDLRDKLDGYDDEPAPAEGGKPNG